MCKIKDGKVMFKNGIEVPATPSVGVVGVAPLYGAIPSGDAGRHGGNLDVPEIRKGSTVYLPVFHEGGLLGLADAHAMDPNGELTAMDIPATITFSVDLIKGKEINWPRIDNEEYIMSVNTNSPIVPSAVNCGISELILWLGEHGIDMWKAWEKIALVAEFPISRFNPPVLNAKFPKKYIKT
jgi:amidase